MQFRVLTSLSVCLYLMATAKGQEAEEEEICVCVHPSNCIDGIVKPNLSASEMDYRYSSCPGVRACCSLPEGSNPPRPGGTSTSQPSLVSPTISLSNGDVGGQSEAFVVQEEPPASKMQLPAKAELQGCGVRRFNGSQPKIDLSMIKINADDPENQSLVETFYGELPWLVRILVNGEFTCGASLISSHVVLTSAHCIEEKNNNDLTLVAGEWDADTEVEAQSPQKRSVARIVKHEGFVSSNGQHDVALLFPDTPFNLTLVVDSICYPETLRDVNQNECFAAGWGKGKREEPGYSPVVRKVHMPILDRTRCEKKFRQTSLGNQFILLPGFMCAGGIDNRDTCKGDGGGPLYCSMKNEPNRFAIIGVISWGIDCGRGNPTVSASVAYYYDWIARHIHDYPDLKIASS